MLPFVSIPPTFFVNQRSQILDYNGVSKREASAFRARIHYMCGPNFWDFDSPTRTLSDVWWVGQITHKMDVVLADYQRGLSIPRSALMFRSSLIVDLIATLKIGDYDYSLLTCYDKNLPISFLDFLS